MTMDVSHVWLLRNICVTSDHGCVPQLTLMEYLCHKCPWMCPTDDCYGISVSQVTMDVSHGWLLRNICVTSDHGCVPRLTVTVYLCHKWPWMCPTVDCYGISVSQVTMDVSHGWLLRNICVTSDHGCVPRLTVTEYLCHKWQWMCPTVDCYGISVSQVIMDVSHDWLLRNICVTSDHGCVPRLTVTEYLCHKWPWMCPTYGISVSQVTMDVSHLRNICVTSDHGCVPLTEYLCHKWPWMCPVT